MNGPGSATWSNERWLEALRDPGYAGHEAQAALRAVLCRGLQRAFSSRSDIVNWVEDYAQESILRILKDLSTFRGESRFTTWALSIAVRVSYDDLRRKRWQDVSLEAFVESGEQRQLAQPESSERGVARQQALEALSRAMVRHLTEKQRIALTAELREMPQSEIARQLGTTRNAVYKLTHDARKALKQMLIEDGITADVIGWAFAQDEGVTHEAR